MIWRLIANHISFFLSCNLGKWSVEQKHLPAVWPADVSSCSTKWPFTRETQLARRRNSSAVWPTVTSLLPTGFPLLAVNDCVVVSHGQEGARCQKEKRRNRWQQRCSSHFFFLDLAVLGLRAHGNYTKRQLHRLRHWWSLATDVAGAQRLLPTATLGIKEKESRKKK